MTQEELYAKVAALIDRLDLQATEASDQTRAQPIETEEQREARAYNHYLIGVAASIATGLLSGLARTEDPQPQNTAKWSLSIAEAIMAEFEYKKRKVL